MWTCKRCKKDFNFTSKAEKAGHGRWCPENPNSKNTDNIKEAKRKKAEEKFGLLLKFEVRCFCCGNFFQIEEREKKFPEKEKYFCSRSCANSNRNPQWTDEMRKAASERSKKLWDDTEYAKKILSAEGRFTSKNEVLIRDYFIENFPEDNWTFGGGLKHDGLRLTRDLYSNKLKTCIEYDGVWHFEDIKGQLQDKQAKDVALEKWCTENEYRLIRIDENVFTKESIGVLIDLVYNSSEMVVKLGNRY